MKCFQHMFVESLVPDPSLGMRLLPWQYGTIWLLLGYTTSSESPSLTGVASFPGSPH